MIIQAKEKKNLKKKKRRSRIIINNEQNESIENKREYYDSDTKLKKSILSAVSYNRFLNSGRNKISKHFLKRKIKSAYEREPLDKVKPFFNVLFIPSANMFNPPQPQNVVPQVNPLIQKQNIQQAKIEKPIEPSKPMFNSISEIKAVEVKNEIPKIEPNVIQIRLNETKQEKPITVKPQDLSQQQKQSLIFKQLCEKYMNNPEKMKNELSPHDLQKLQMFIKKNLNSSQEQLNLQILKNNLSGTPVSINIGNQKTNPIQVTSSKSNTFTLPVDNENLNN